MTNTCVPIKNRDAIFWGGACKSVVATLIAVGLCCGEAKAVDSFFDVWLDLADNGQLVLAPEASTAFPFPPPPLDFPDIPVESSLVDIQIVELSLVSSQPFIVSPPQPSGDFLVNSFFDIDYQIEFSENNGPASSIDSFFDIDVQLRVTPETPRPVPLGEEQTFDIEIVSMELAGPINLDQGLNMELQLIPAFHGHVTVLKSPAPGGGDQFQVDSFFDIFVEVSLNGGPLVEAMQPNPLHLESHVTTVVPEPSTLLLGILAIGALWVRRKK